MKTAYSLHAHQSGKVLPEGWDRARLEEPAPKGDGSGMAYIAEEQDLVYNPEPFD